MPNNITSSDHFSLKGLKSFGSKISSVCSKFVNMCSGFKEIVCEWFQKDCPFFFFFFLF